MATSELLTLLLETYGAYLTTATSIQEGITQVEIMVPDIIISNMNLPDGSSKDFLTHFQNSPQPQIQQISIIVITSATYLAESQVAHEVEAAGFQGFLAKPINPTQLMELIVALLPRRT